MAGKRVKTLDSTQEYFLPELVVLVDKIDTGSGDWLLARKMAIGLLGNTRFRGSTNYINWHDDITALDTYIQFSTDNGGVWVDLNTDIIQEGANEYFTEAKVLAMTEINDLITDTHTHSNLSILENIVDNGSGNLFLANDGTYKAYPNKNAVSKTSSYAATAADDIILLDASGTDVTLYLPSASSYTGHVFDIKCIDNTNQCEVDPNGGYIDNSTSIIPLSLMESLTVVAYNNKWWIL